jgi:ribonucleoside-diphosphate reductase alpha chain
MTNKQPKDIPMQPASLDIWDKKYRLTNKTGEPIDQDIDGTYKRVARALSDVEQTQELRDHWNDRFLWAIRNGAIPAGRITSNAGAQQHKPETSLINCTVSESIHDSMDNIMKRAHEAALTLKAGCVSAGTSVVTECGVVPVEVAVSEKHKEILSFNCITEAFEFKKILKHIEVVVEREDNIRIHSGYGSLTTSVKHPVLVWREEESKYVRADEVRGDDALIHYTPGVTRPKDWMSAWFAGAHLGDGSAYQLGKQYSDTKRGRTWMAKSVEAGHRLVFKMRAAERLVVERYSEFFASFSNSTARVSSTVTTHGTPVWDFAVCSFGASKAIELVDYQSGKKSRTLTVPEWVSRSTSHYLPFLAGVVDTDGTVSASSQAVIISSVSHDFIHKIGEMVGVLGYNTSIILHRNRSHMLNEREVIAGDQWILKINDLNLISQIAEYMADDGKRNKIFAIKKTSGQYDNYRMTRALSESLAMLCGEIGHKDRQRLGFYHRYHLEEIVSRVWLDKWQKEFPQLSSLIAKVMTLRPVRKIEMAVDVDKGFYDFEVDENNNYCAGIGSLAVMHNCGIGYSFSTLRPKGAFVAGAGAYTSGPMSFMDIFDKTCFTVASAGGRRGAQMGTFDVSHPDVKDFVLAKREDARLRQFNLSLLITDDFMSAVENNQPWALTFPVHKKELAEINLDDPSVVVWKEWPITEGYTVREDGLVACRIYDHIPARRLWDLIMSSTYDYAEPGFILIDRVNEMNNNWWCENIQATNPCGEQPLCPSGSCLLGSINLTKFVSNPFTDRAAFDWDSYREVISVFTRMLDNVVELNGLPLEKQRHEIMEKRRHGMGFLGLGSTLTMLRIPYGSEQSVEFTTDVSREMAVEGWRCALELAKEKGPAPLLAKNYRVTAEMLRKRPEMVSDEWAIGDEITGAQLHAKYSRYMQRIAEVDPKLVAELAKVGARFTHHSSIAPTGTISLSLANNASNGIEPSFGHHYSRNIIREGRKAKEKVDVYSFELLAYRELVDQSASPTATDAAHALPDYFVVADQVTPKQHVDIQAASQYWIDSSISKTANVPTDFPFEDFKDIYLYAYHQGLKGCTTFRFNPAVFQGVLVKEQDLADTTYQFTLDDGSTIEVKGNENVTYEGETHSAANLFDALKEGYYGKF